MTIRLALLAVSAADPLPRFVATQKMNATLDRLSGTVSALTIGWLLPLIPSIPVNTAAQPSVYARGLRVTSFSTSPHELFRVGNASRNYVATGREGFGFHHFGDITFRVVDASRPAPPPLPPGGILVNHSIHCMAPDHGQCIVKIVAGSTVAACGALCNGSQACACWSIATASGECYLLNNATRAPSIDAAASCGWKESWSPGDSDAGACNRTSGVCSYSSAAGRAPVAVVSVGTNTVTVNLTATVAAGSGGHPPFEVLRTIAVDPAGNGDLLWEYRLTNTAAVPLTLGSFGLSLPFNQV